MRAAWLRCVAFQRRESCAAANLSTIDPAAGKLVELEHSQFASPWYWVPDIAMRLSVSVCQFVREHISKTGHPNHQIFDVVPFCQGRIKTKLHGLMLQQWRRVD